MKAIWVSFLKKGWQSVLLEFPVHQLLRTLVVVPLGALDTLLGFEVFQSLDYFALPI